MKNTETQDVRQAHNELLQAHNEIMECIRDMFAAISTDLAIVRENTEKLLQYRDIDKGYIDPCVVLEKIEAELDNDVSVLQKMTGKDEKDG